MDTDTINNGDKVKDKVTGITGTVVAVITRLYGGASACVAYADSTGRSAEDWIDLDRLEAA